MWAPSGGALIEMVPHGFLHAHHYIQGGHTNLWYGHMMFETLGRNVRDGPGAENLNQVIRMTDGDIQEIETLIDDAVKYLRTRKFR